MNRIDPWVQATLEWTSPPAPATSPLPGQVPVDPWVVAFLAWIDRREDLR